MLPMAPDAAFTVGKAAAATNGGMTQRSERLPGWTVSDPVAAPAGTVVVMDVSLEGAAACVAPAPNCTPVLPVNPTTVIVTVVPGTPQSGTNDETVPDAAAGSAVTSTPTTPRASATTVVRALTFFPGSLDRGFLPSGLGDTATPPSVPIPSTSFDLFGGVAPAPPYLVKRPANRRGCV